MPVNAGPEYFAAERRYNQAKTNQEKLKVLEDMLRTAPSHKGAEVLRAEIKQKISKLKGLMEKERVQKSKGFSISVKKEGAAQVMLISAANAGKSLLLSKLTKAAPLVAEYEYTTRMPEIGIMEIGGVKIQIIEMPSVYPDYAYKGNGPAFFSVIRNSDLIIFLIDATKDIRKQIAMLDSEFEKAQIRLNAKRPDIRIKRMGSGGLVIHGAKNFLGNIEDAMKLLRENGFWNAEVDFFGSSTFDNLSDALNDKLVYLPCLYVYNKYDLVDRSSAPKGIKISAFTGYGLEELKEKVWAALGLIRIYTKTPGKPKDWPPVAMKKGSCVKDLALAIHKDFIKKFKFARVWGKSALHEGQKVGINHSLEDEDAVEIHIS